LIQSVVVLNLINDLAEELFRVEDGADVGAIDRFHDEVQVNEVAEQFEELLALVVGDLREASAQKSKKVEQRGLSDKLGITIKGKFSCQGTQGGLEFLTDFLLLGIEQAREDKGVARVHLGSTELVEVVEKLRLVQKATY
jgi:hypothetical protein